MKAFFKLWSLCHYRQILQQLVSILAMGMLLGWAHNASNPIGIRWREVAEPSVLAFQNPQSEVNDNAKSNASMLSSMTNASNVSKVIPSANTANPSTNFFIPPTSTSWAEVKPLHAQQKVVLVDSRPKAFYDASHIPGAISMPEPPSTNEWIAFRKKYALDAHVVIYCSSTNCSLSFKLANRLAQEGYEFVQFITGGYFAWLREESLTKTASSITNNAAVPMAVVAQREIPAQEVAPVLPPIAADPAGQKLENAFPITWLQTRPMLNIGQVVLIDARPRKEFDLGHITGALSIPADSDVATIKQILANRASTTRLVAYCSAMGCPEAFQLSTRLIRELGYPNAQFMLDGFAEWKRFQENNTPKGTNQ